MYKGNNKEINKITLSELYPCTKCPSSDALRVYEHTLKDGLVYHDATCFSCKHYEDNPPGFETTSAKTLLRSNRSSSDVVSVPSVEKYVAPLHDPQDVLSEFKLYPFRDLHDRKINKAACERYGVRVTLSETNGEPVTHMYPYYKKGKFSGYKQRVIESKQMFSKGDCKDAELFGSHVVKPNGKTLYITEGELDCVALYQVLKELSGLPGWEPSVVSLSHGASSAAKDISTSMEFVDSFQKVVLCFDMDDAGQAAVDDACKLLAGKVYIAKYAEKDPNEMLLAGKADELKWDVMKHAKMYMPDAIINYGDMWDRYTAGQDRVSYPWPEAWKEMNQRTYGIRLGELVMVTSGSGMGKTQFLREVEDHYFRTTDFKIADIKLEEDLVDSMDGMMSLYLNKRIHLPDTVTTLEEKKEAFDFYYGSRRFSGYDYFGGLDNDNLFSKIRWFAATGHKVIFLDHLSIIVSEFASDGGERERIDTIMTKLAKMVKELNITIFLVVHLKKTDKQPFEEGHVPSLDDLRGSGTLKQLSMTVIALSRNQQHADGFCANTSELTVLKCRFTGRTGTADYLNFNDKTGRMVQVPKPQNYRPAKKEFKPNFSAPSPY